MSMVVKPHQAFFLAAQTDHAAGLLPVPGRVRALFPSLRPHPARLAERYGWAAGVACKDVEARKTRMAAPINFSRWFGKNNLRCPFAFR